MDDDRITFEEILAGLARLVDRIGRMNPASTDRSGEPILTGAEARVVRSIGGNPDHGVTEIARSLGLTKGAVSQVIAKLVEKKIVRRNPAEADGRRTRLELTHEGWSAFFAKDRAHRSIFEAAYALWGDDLPRRLGALHALVGDLDAILDRCGDN